VNTPLIIGHRGASAVAPENTLAAFEAAIAAGADGVEFDVRLTRDGVPVVIHDETLHRTGGLRSRVADLTLADLDAVDAGSWFARARNLSPGQFASQRVPSLEQLFELFHSNDLILYLEMKCQPLEQRALAEACCRLVREHGLSERILFECFELPALEIVRSIDPSIKTAPLFSRSPRASSTIVNQATAIGASALALHYRRAGKQLVEEARLAGLNVAVWTVDDPAWIERARALGVDALITNDPAAMLAHR
jgi:glycerophosphoryl diester phosphodiesterase